MTPDEMRRRAALFGNPHPLCGERTLARFRHCELSLILAASLLDRYTEDQLTAWPEAREFIDAAKTFLG